MHVWGKKLKKKLPYRCQLRLQIEKKIIFSSKCIIVFLLLIFFRVIFCFIKKIGISYKVLLQFHDTGIYHNVWRNIMLLQLMLLRSIIFWGLNQPTSSHSKMPSSFIVSILHTLMAFYVTYQCDRIIKCQFSEKYHLAKFWISFGSVSLQSWALNF